MACDVDPCVPITNFHLVCCSLDTTDFATNGALRQELQAIMGWSIKFLDGAGGCSARRKVVRVGARRRHAFLNRLPRTKCAPHTDSMRASSGFGANALEARATRLESRTS